MSKGKIKEAEILRKELEAYCHCLSNEELHYLINLANELLEIEEKGGDPAELLEYTLDFSKS